MALFNCMQKKARFWAFFLIVAKGTYPASLGRKKGMYPEINSLPKQHTSQSLLRGMLIAALFFVVSGGLFAQNTASIPSSMADEIRNIENTINRQGVPVGERRQALMRLARLRQLSGDMEGAAASWLEAAFVDPGNIYPAALLACAFTLAAMGEWDRAAAAINPLLAPNFPSSAIVYRARFLDACIRAMSGDISVLAAMANNPRYSGFRSEIYYVLWRVSGNMNTAQAENWRQRLIAQFPQSPEGRIAAAESGRAGSVRAWPSPMWLLFPGREAVTVHAVPVTPGPAAVAATPAASARLQTGLFSSQANAQGQVEQLRRAGFSAGLERRLVSGREQWAVIVTAAGDTNQVILQLRNAGFESFPLR